MAFSQEEAARKVALAEPLLPGEAISREAGIHQKLVAVGSNCSGFEDAPSAEVKLKWMFADTELAVGGKAMARRDLFRVFWSKPFLPGVLADKIEQHIQVHPRKHGRPILIKAANMSTSEHLWKEFATPDLAMCWLRTPDKAMCWLRRERSRSTPTQDQLGLLRGSSISFLLGLAGSAESSPKSQDKARMERLKDDLMGHYGTTKHAKSSFSISFGDFLPRDGSGDLDRPSLLKNILAGIVCGVKISLGMVVFASLMWTQSPTLGKHLALAIKMNYLTAAVLLGVYLLLGQIPFAMVLCQDIPSLLLGKMGILLEGSLERPENLVPNFVALVAMQAFFSGALFFFYGYFGLTGLVHQVPHAVIQGFGASCGAGLWRAAFSKLTNTSWAAHGFWPLYPEHVLEPMNLLLFVIGILCFLLLLKGPDLIVAIKGEQSIWCAWSAPLCMFSPVIMFFIVMTVLYGSWDLALDAARTWSWLNPPSPQTTDYFWSYWRIAYDFDAIEFGVLLDFFPSMLSCALLSLLESVFNLSQIEAKMDEQLDFRREMIAFGTGNTICGCLGANMGYLQAGMSLNAKRDGGSCKVCLSVACMFATLLFMSSAPVADYIPKFTQGSVFVLVGYGFLKEKLWDSREELPLYEYVLVWIITIISVMIDINTAIGSGILLSTVIFMTQTFYLPAITSVARADIVRSEKTQWSRCAHEVQFLSEKGIDILIITCSGFLFWAKVRSLVETIMDYLQPGRCSVRFILIQMKFVPRVDVSAMKGLEKCFRAAHKCDVRIGLCHMEKMSRDLLKSGKLIADQSVGGHLCMPNADYFETLDEGLEVYEDYLLQEIRHEFSIHEQGALSPRSSKHGIDANSDLPRNAIQALQKLTETSLKNYEVDETIIHADSPHTLPIVMSGEAVCKDTSTIYTEGQVIGALDFALKRNAEYSVYAARKSEILHVSHQAVEILRTREPVHALALAELLNTVLRDHAFRILCSESARGQRGRCET